jgi:hypothetical protein
MADAELAEIEAQQEDEDQFPSDNFDEDYQPILEMAPHPHDREARSSCLALAQPSRTDPALHTLLQSFRDEQVRQAQEQA